MLGKKIRSSVFETANLRFFIRYSGQMLSRQLNAHSWSLGGLSDGVRKLGSFSLQMTLKALRMGETVTRDKGCP